MSIHYEELNIDIDFEKYVDLDKRGWKAFNHQEDGIKFLINNKKCILADDMGLGKTTSTIISALETGAKKVLIICPASLKINWQREIENYSDRTTSIIEGKKWDDADFVIINYDIIKNFHDDKKKSESTIVKSKFDLQNFDSILK